MTDTPDTPDTLRAAMAQYHREEHKLAVLLINARGNVVHRQTEAQLQVLEAAEALDIPLYYVELEPRNPEPAISPVGRRLSVPGARMISKPHNNAFAPNVQPNLDRELKQQNIRVLVMMGYASPLYVRDSALGSPDFVPRPGHPFGSGPYRPGATQLGYTVLTSEQVLGGDASGWKDARGLHFYEAV